MGFIKFKHEHYNPSAAMKKLLFVDTNIYLDFYRARNETGLGLLKHLDAIKDQLIVTDQIEMEFLKHRQGALLETINYLKAPAKISRPGLLSEHKSLIALQRDIDDCGKHVRKLADGEIDFCRNCSAQRTN